MKKFAFVKSGHDKRHVYMIAEEDENYVYLVNGTNRTFANPKKKSRKHIQIVERLPEEVAEILSQNVEEDHKIRKAVKCLMNHMN